MELCPESLLESSNLVVLVLLLLLLLLDDDDVEDCIEDRAEDDFAELSAKIELEDDKALSSTSIFFECSDFSFKINSLTTAERNRESHQFQRFCSKRHFF